MKLENLRSPIDMHTHASSALDNPVTLTFDLLPSRSMHAKRLWSNVCLPSLASIAQAAFLLQRDTQTPLITHVGNVIVKPLSTMGYTSRASVFRQTVVLLT